MARFEVKSRRITVDQTLYTYSVAQKREGIQLLVYRDKRPFLRLEQDWTEAWGINLYRPGVVARIIRHYRQRGAPPEPLLLCREPELFTMLVEFCFAPEEQKEKEWFLQCRARIQAQSTSEDKGEMTL